MALSNTNQTPLFFDTEIAFRHMSTPQLRFAKFLFSLMQNTAITNIGTRVLQQPGTLFIPSVPTLVRKTLFKHFCGGETVEEALGVLQFLRSHGVSGILDFAAERGECDADFERSRGAVLKTIQAVSSFSGERLAVFKPTALIPFAVLNKLSNEIELSPNEQKQWETGHARVLDLCQAAAKADVTLMADAEESWIQPAVDSLMQDMMRKYNENKARIFTTIQFYRTGRVEQLASLLNDAQKYGYVLGVKAVRGAYMEKEMAFAQANGVPSAVHASKNQTDEHFNLGVKLALTNLDHVSICVATHNEDSVLRVISEMNALNLHPENSRVSFSQLYGMSDHITFNLDAARFRTSKYIPYGTLRETIPYLMRRAQENSSVRGHTSREVELLSRELARRQAL